MSRKTCMFFLLALITTLPSLSFAGDSYRQRLSKARRLYNEGKINPAGKELVRLIKDYPKRKEVIELLALVYFEKGQFAKSRELFNKVNPSSISAEAGYAWGASFYSAEKWKKAILGFKKVPRKSPYRPLATYFLGVSLFRLNRLDSAKKHLLRARSKELLPVMARNRKRFLEEIKLREKEERNEILEDGGMSFSAHRSTRGILMKEQQLTENYFLRKEDQNPQSKPTPRSYKIQPFIKYTQISRNLNNHQFVDESLDVSAYRGGISGTYFEKDLRSKINNRGCLASLGYGEISFDSSSSKFVSLEQTTGGFVQSTKEKRSESYLLIDIEPFLTHSISSSSTVQVSGNIRYNTSPGESDDTWGHYLARGNYQYKLSLHQLNFMTSVAQRFDQNIGSNTQEIVLGAEFAKDTGAWTYSLEGHLTSRSGTINRENNPFRVLLISHPLEPMNGYASLLELRGKLAYSIGEGELISTNSFIQRSEVEASSSRLRPTDLIETYAGSIIRTDLTYHYPIFDGTNLFIGGLYEMIGDYRYDLIDEDTAETTVYAADATSQGFHLGATSKPLDWIRLGMNLGVLQHEFQAVNFEPSDTFDQANPNYVSFSQFYLHAFHQF